MSYYTFFITELITNRSISISIHVRIVSSKYGWFLLSKNFRECSFICEILRNLTMLFRVKWLMIKLSSIQFPSIFRGIRSCSRTVAILSSHLRLYFGGGYISSKILQWEKDEISLFLLHFNIAWSLRFSAVSVWLWLEWHRFRKFYISKKLFVQLNLRIKLLIFEVQTWKQ